MVSVFAPSWVCYDCLKSVLAANMFSAYRMEVGDFGDGCRHISILKFLPAVVTSETSATNNRTLHIGTKSNALEASLESPKTAVTMFIENV